MLHITNAFPYAEVPEYGVFVKEQIDSLDRAGVETKVLFMNGRRDGKSAYTKGVSDIRKAAANYDILHCHHLYSGFATALAFTGKPVVLSFLNDWLHEMDGVKSEMARKLGCGFGVRWADRVIFKSPVPAALGGSDRYLNLPNGVNATQFRIIPRQEARARLGLSPDAVYVLFVSSKDKNRAQKRYDRFAATMDIVRETNPGKQIEELVLVNQPRERVLDFFNSADLHLLSSDFEGSPNSVKEALCCGTPVVTTDVGNVKEMLEGVPNSYVSSSTEPQTLAELVQKVVSADVDREAVRDGFLAKGLSQEAIAQKLISVYEETIARKSKDRK
ncbi:hypothetical protein ASD47_10960 [Caulobacter sp. Root1472]|nr:hypothetical protein ASD47_10960 [Caulobacter sp. Root1472]